MLREIRRPTSLGEEMLCKPLRSPLLELTRTVGIVFDNLSIYRSQGFTEENPVASVFPRTACLRSPGELVTHATPGPIADSESLVIPSGTRDLISFPCVSKEP